MSPKGIYEVSIKPNFELIQKLLNEGKNETDICRKLNINTLVWKSCKNTFPEFVQLIESVLGTNSMYYKRVYPFLDRIEGWLNEGINESAIASKLGVPSNDFFLFKKIYPEFGDFIFRCRDNADGIIEHAVFKSARGFTYEEKKESIEEGEVLYDDKGEVRYQKNPDGTFKLSKDGSKVPMRKHGKVKVEKVTKEALPNISAGQFWLTNRRRDSWALRSDSNHFVSATDAAKAIKETLNDMEETVPQRPAESSYEVIVNQLKNLSPEELLKAKETLEVVIEKTK